MEKMGIDWQAKKAEFEAYLKQVEAGDYESLYDPRLSITSGPGFEQPLQLAQGEKQQQADAAADQ